MASPTRYPSGVVNRPAVHPMNQFQMPDPTRVYTAFDDFSTFYLAAGTLPGWFVTQANPSVVPNASASTLGVLTFSNAAVAAAFTVIQRVTNFTGPVKETTFLPVAGKKFWLRSRFKVAIAAQQNVYIGAAVASVDPFGTVPPDQFAFRSLNATPQALLFTVGPTTGTAVTASLGTTTDNVFTTCTAYYDGKDTVSVWRELDDGTFVAKSSVSVVNGTLLPDALMGPTIGMQTKSGATDLMSVDYLLIAQER